MAEARCLCCNGAGDVYYIASRPEIIGGKRARCDDCDGTGRVTVAVAQMQGVLRRSDRPIGRAESPISLPFSLQRDT